MKFQVAKQDLEKALKAVGNSLSGAPDLSGHFLFRHLPNAGDRIEIRTYSGRLYSGAPCVAQVEGDDASFTIEGSRLKSLLGVIDDCALDFDFDGTVVTLNVPGLGAQTFESLDAEAFPHWDATLAKAKTTSKMPVGRLVSALTYCRPFISVKENEAPHLSVCEVHEGVLGASRQDEGAGVYLAVPLLKDSTLRIQVKDLNAVLAFLVDAEGEVEVKETEKYAFFLTSDGSIFGSSRYLAEYPSTKIPPDGDQHWWKINVARALKALPFLKSGSDKENVRVRLTRPDPDGPIMFQMLSKTGRMTSVPVPCIESGSQDDAQALPPNGFSMGYNPLLKLLELHRDQETLTLGVNRRGNTTGYIKVVESKFGNNADSDKYVTVLIWLQGV